MSSFGIRLDLRDLPVEKFDDAVAIGGGEVTFLMSAWQFSSWSGQYKSSSAHRIAVMVPDFLLYARLGSTGQAKQIPRLAGSVIKVLESGLANLPLNIKNVPGLATGDFWTAAETLLAYDMGLLPRRFAGEVLLHYNLSDFVWLFDRRKFLATFLGLSRKVGRWGIATQQPAKALSACARWNHYPDRLLYTSGAKRSEALLLETAKQDAFQNMNLTLDLTQIPEEFFAGGDMAELKRSYDDEWLIRPHAAAVQSLLKKSY